VAKVEIWFAKKDALSEFGVMKIKLLSVFSLALMLTLAPKNSLLAKEASRTDASLFPAKILNNMGKVVSSKVLKDKIVGIYFSAQWCPPCRNFTPALVEFRDKNAKEFEVVFVSSDRSQEDQLKYMQKYGMKWYALPHGSDEANQLKKKFEVRGIPSLVIVDKEGNTITKNGRSDVSGNPSGALTSWQKKS
jgi:nucleoredoxin